MTFDARTPVIIGIGRAGNESTGDDDPGDDALELMIRAARAAIVDTGAPSVAGALGRVAVPAGTWRYKDPGRYVAGAIGASSATTALIGLGIPQQTLLNDAYRDVLRGAIDAVLVVGGEAAHRSARARRCGITLTDHDRWPDHARPDEMRHPDGEIVSPEEIAAGLYVPAEQYALIDCSLRGAEGRSLDEHRDDIAELWAGFSSVASGFAHAAFREARDPASIREPGPRNRPIAFPYNTWHCSQMNVDQAAAVVVCNAGTARDLGVAPEQLVHPIVALESSHSLAVARRRDLHRWPAMEVLGRVAAAHLSGSLTSIEHVEFYSCFPAAVRVQQRALGFPVDSVPTITGGLTFAGGPFNNFVLQATVAMVDRLRSDRGARGLVTTVSGFLHKPGLAVYSTEPDGCGPLVADLAEDAGAATASIELLASHHGSARVAAYTVGFRRAETARVIVLAETSDGGRCIATSTNESLVARALTDDLLGVDVSIAGTELLA